MDLMERITRIERILKSIQHEIVKIYTKQFDNGESIGIEDQAAKSIEDYLLQVKDNIVSGQFTIDHHDQDQVLGLTSNILDFDDFMDFEDTPTNYDGQTIIDEVKPDIRSNSTYKLMQECLNKRAFVVLEKLELPTITILPISNANLKARKHPGRYRKLGTRKKRSSKLKLSKYDNRLKNSFQSHQDKSQEILNTVFEPEEMQYEKVGNIYHCKSISCVPLYRKFPTYEKFEEHYERVHTLLKTPLNCGLDGCLMSLYSHKEMNFHKDQIHSSCSKCSSKFGTRRELLRHLRGSHKTDQFKCKLCSRVYMDSNNLRQHFMRVHIEKKNYSNKRISKYNDGTRTLPKLDTKLNPTSNEQDPEEDNLDSNVFELYKDLCKKNSYFKCDIDNCGKVITKKGLGFHKYTHEIPDFDLHWKKLSCAVCRNIFTNKVSLRKHIMAEHFPSSLKYQFKCTICDKIFTTNHSLKTHKERVHLIPNLFQNRPLTLTSKSHSRSVISKDNTIGNIPLKSKIPQSYKCTMCDKSFSLRHTLKRHEKTHSRSAVISKDNNTNSYKCTICDKAFKHLNIFKRHENNHSRSQHNSLVFASKIRDPQTCSLCNKIFKNKFCLERHEKLHSRPTTTATYHCPKPNCKKTFNLEVSLKNHLNRRHGDIKCPVEDCIYHCTSQASYDTHMENYHGEKVVCPICSKMFPRVRLSTHIWRYHRQFKCTFEGCSAEFHRELPFMKHQAGHDPNLKPEFLSHHFRFYHATKMSCPYEGCITRVGNTRAFTQQDKLTEHINTVHKHEKIIKKKKK